MKIIPLQDRVLVKRVETEERTKGGILIPTTAQEKAIEAKVMAVGAGKRNDDGKRIEPMVKVGDRIIFAKWSGSEIKVDGEDHLFLREEEILAVFDRK